MAVSARRQAQQWERAQESAELVQRATFEQQQRLRWRLDGSSGCRHEGPLAIRAGHNMGIPAAELNYPTLGISAVWFAPIVESWCPVSISRLFAPGLDGPR